MVCGLDNLCGCPDHSIITGIATQRTRFAAEKRCSLPPVLCVYQGLYRYGRRYENGPTRDRCPVTDQPQPLPAALVRPRWASLLDYRVWSQIRFARLYQNEFRLTLGRDLSLETISVLADLCGQYADILHDAGLPDQVDVVNRQMLREYEDLRKEGVIS